MNKKMLLAVFAATLTGATVFTASPAFATARNGVCESGEFCLYYNSDHQGSMVDLTNSWKDYGSNSASCVKFITSGSGRGLCVKNNAASVWNRESTVVTVFYKSDWAGAIDSIPSGARVNLKSTLKNENAGHVIGESANTNLGGGLYSTTGGSITSYFDGYLSTAGRHEGIDFARNVGDPVHALIPGTVTNKEEGHTGSGGLSTLAIYNATLDKTVVYLHTDPLNGLSEGEHVDRGDQIGWESWRGVSSSGSAHTHVEMRPGRQLRAARSVDDYTLDNPIPTEFWMNRGYNICCG